MKTPFLVVLMILAGMAMAIPVSAVDGWTYEITAEPLGTKGMVFSQQTDYTFDAAPDGNAIQRLSWNLPSGTTVYYTLWYGNDSTVTGHLAYTNVGSFRQRSEVSMGDQTSGYDYTGVQEIGRIDIVGYARNKSEDGSYTKGLIAYDSVFGISERKAFVFYPVSNDPDNVITKVQFHSNQPVSGAVFYNPHAAVAKAASESLLDVINEWVQLALQYASLLKDFLISAFYWAKFLLWDNLVLEVALYIAITMAISFGKARDVFTGIRNFIKYQKAIYSFILDTWNTIVMIISNFRGIFRI